MNKTAEEKIETLRNALAKSQEIMNEIAAYGSCDCDEDTEGRCLFCQCCVHNEYSKELLQGLDDE